MNENFKDKYLRWLAYERGFDYKLCPILMEIIRASTVKEDRLCYSPSDTLYAEIAVKTAGTMTDVMTVCQLTFYSAGLISTYYEDRGIRFLNPKYFGARKWDALTDIRISENLGAGESRIMLISETDGVKDVQILRTPTSPIF